MHSRNTTIRKGRAQRASRPIAGRAVVYSTARRSECGSLMPFLAMSVITIMGGMALIVDIAQDFQTMRQLEFAAREVALYAYSYKADASLASQTQVSNRVLSAGNQGWNRSLQGQGAKTNSFQPVTFGASDVSFITNGADENEQFLQVTARRDGAAGITQLFTPLLYTNFHKAVPNSVRTLQTHRTVEVIGQPATRIGPGAPLSAAGNTRQGDFVRCCTFPVAISNQQFQTFVTKKSPVQITVVMQPQPTTGSNTANGAFVNLAPGSSGLSYYGTAQSNSDVEQLLGQLQYFGAAITPPVATFAPAAVEVGSQLNVFDVTDPNFTQNQQKVAGALQQLSSTGQFLMMPVLASNPLPGGQNRVLGFARVQLQGTQTSTKITVNLGTSEVMLNATSGKSPMVTTSAGAPMPNVAAPFLPRPVDLQTNSV
ncbi:MAG TPA: hypothetical protein V6C72_04195, partial [Chroococcales cyanobacterium]